MSISQSPLAFDTNNEDTFKSSRPCKYITLVTPLTVMLLSTALVISLVNVYHLSLSHHFLTVPVALSENDISTHCGE